METATKIKVVFRKWRTGDKGIIALFPDEPGSPGFCMSYEHIGQHGSADYTGVIQQTTPATPAEYAALARELRGCGYILASRQRR